MRRLLAMLALLLPPAVAGAGGVEGRVSVALPGVELADVAPIVVYLEPAASAGRTDAGHATLRQHDARFAPSFLAIAAGTTVEMPNDDDIFHNVFSFSAPNDFDLGLYPSGQARSVRFAHPGTVRLYCSIHESMTGTIFVAPTRHFTVAEADGSFALPDVPPGAWTLVAWSERLPDERREVRIGAGTLSRDLRFGEIAGGERASR